MPSLTIDTDLINSLSQEDEADLKQLYNLHYKALCYNADHMSALRKKLKTLPSNPF